MSARHYIVVGVVIIVIIIFVIIIVIAILDGLWPTVWAGLEGKRVEVKAEAQRALRILVLHKLA